MQRHSSDIASFGIVECIANFTQRRPVFRHFSTEPARVAAVLGLLAAVWGGIASETPFNPLACRFANYTPFEEAAWNHLPSIGIHFVFMNMPAPVMIDAIRGRLSTNHLTALILRGQTDFSQPTGLNEIAEQLATCERLGVRYLFLSVKRNGLPKAEIYERLRQAGEIGRRHDVIIAIETHPDLGTNGDVLLETMQRVNHPNVRVNFDQTSK